MTTPFSDVFDLFMQLQQDYRLIEIYKNSEADFTTYLQGWLIHSINDFSVCNQSLAYDDTLQEFTENLSDDNKVILSQIMVKYWLMKEVQDVLQMRWNLQDTDFKHYAESQNLQAKSSHLDKVKESISQSLIEYSYRKNDWENWLSGNFMGSN